MTIAEPGARLLSQFKFHHIAPVKVSFYSREIYVLKRPLVAPLTLLVSTEKQYCCRSR